MSTEATESADKAKKKSKHKKNKGYTDNNTKKQKRKREEQEAEEDAAEEQIEERTTKKHKKDHKKARSADQLVEPKKSLLEQHSPFVQQTTSFYLALSPCAHAFALEGLLAEHISPLILTYVPPLKGILLSYENPRMSEQPSGVRSKDAEPVMSQSLNEYGVTFVWLTAEFTVFRPRKGTYLEGFVNVQNESMLGLVCHNFFNAMIERDKLPKDWKWVDDSDEGAQTQTRKRTLQGVGHFEDGGGEEIEGKLVFRVDDFEANPGSDGGPGTVSLVGTLRFDHDEP